MTIIGITGGIGSGKSIVCKLLSVYNIPIYDADKEAKDLNNTSSIIRDRLIERFGSELYINNRLDKAQLANLIFSNKDNLAFVNSVIHTELAKHFLNWVEIHNNYSIVVIDAAVLLEAGFQQYVNKVITVVSPIDTRIERVSKRDGLTQEQIKSRIQSQMSDKERINLSDFVIVNDNKESIVEQTSNILKSIYNPLPI